MTTVSFSVRQIVEVLGGELSGDDSVVITQVAPLERAAGSDIGFVAHAKYRKALDATHAGALILPRSLADAWSGTRIVVDDPYLYFARVTQLLNPVTNAYAGIHPTAVVLSDLPPGIGVGPLAFIGEDCHIAAGVVIGPGAIVEQGTTIGENTLLHAKVVVYAGSQIGARCVLHSGAIIGGDGFGFARRKDGGWEKIPQIGRVILGDDVEVGANTTIDRGALDDTVIENGVKLDNLIQIAHNCRVGENSAMAAFAGMAGSSKLGKRVMVGGQAGIMGHIEVADDVVVSSRSFMSKSVSEKGVYTSTIPAIQHNDWLRNAVHIKHLDEMADRIKQLEKKLERLDAARDESNETGSGK
ncbi:MAG TPA: UDP-3-O-(3-hydroxymyristoyl)glucosamine N-acyltransferase [Rhodocyclaceae bacterium]|nr:UDP-3-O-(3-hydroxymyristoyl)glucosamine N-acyltransferase [Rhodocyclaceae bacterium]